MMASSESEVARLGRLRRNATYRAKHREILSAKTIQWRKDNPEKAAVTIKNASLLAEERRKSIPEVAEAKRNQVRLYRARKAEVGGNFRPVDIDRKLLIQGGRCSYCRVSLVDGYETDHIVPVSKGGPPDFSNLQITCPRCNKRKHNKDHDAFLKEVIVAEMTDGPVIEDVIASLKERDGG